MEETRRAFCGGIDGRTDPAIVEATQSYGAPTNSVRARKRLAMDAGKGSRNTRFGMEPQSVAPRARTMEPARDLIAICDRERRLMSLDAVSGRARGMGIYGVVR